MRIGEVVIDAVHDGTTRIAASRLLEFTGTDPDPWAAHRGVLDDEGRMELAFGAFLVRSRDRLVLVDAGYGPAHAAGGAGGELLDGLAALGVAPGDVTDVVLTHLHVDHVGWATVDGEPVFARAAYRCHADDWDHFVSGASPDPVVAGHLAPVAPLLELFDGDVAVAPGVDVRHAPGHTPGSTLVVVSSGDERALLVGDVVHCPVELTEGEWEGLYDVDRALAARTREALARELEGTDVPVAAAHFPGLRFGRLLRGVGRRSWTFDLGGP